MAIHDAPEPVGWQSLPPRLTLPIAILSVLVAVYGAYNQHRAAIDMRASADRLAQQLRSTQIALDKANMENAALEHVSLPGLFRQYDAHIAMLRTAADADTDVYETVKNDEGKKETGSDAAFALLQAESNLYVATDNFTDFVDRWRVNVDLLNKMLDGNVTQLKRSRDENNIADVRDMAQRIVRDASTLETPLRAAIDALKSASH